MFNPTQVLIKSFITKINMGCCPITDEVRHTYTDLLHWVATLALETIASSDALYHNIEHTIFVTLVGQEILWGKYVKVGHVLAEDWLHFMISLICHDIGYVKGICQLDQESERLFATGQANNLIYLPEGATDASLAPYHVDRGKLFIEERFKGHPLLNIDVIKHNIELTRFPVPLDGDHQDTKGYPGLVRAADLIGQMSDPRYLQKIPALFFEFEETGVNQKLGYANPEDLRRNYPKFYWNSVYPYIIDASRYLKLTQAGNQILANLYSHVFEIEHEFDLHPCRKPT